MKIVRNDAKIECNAVKAGSEKIADAIGKIKSTNNTEQTAALTPAVSSIHRGLTSLVTSANRIAERIRAHPTDLRAAAESGQAIQEQFAKLLDDTKKYGEATAELQGTVGEVEKAANWIGSNYPADASNVPVANYGRVVGSFDSLR